MVQESVVVNIKVKTDVYNEASEIVRQFLPHHVYMDVRELR